MTSSNENPEKSSRSLARDSVGTTLTYSGLFILGLIIFVVIARVLGPTWRGALGIVMLAPGIVLRIGNLGYEHGLVVIGGKTRDLLGPLTRTGIVYGFITGLISIGILMGFMWGFPKTFWGINQVWLPLPFMIITLAFPLHLMTLVYDGAIYAEDRIAARNKKELVVNIAMLIAIIVATFIFNYWLMGIVAAYIIAQCVSLFYAMILVRGRVKLSGGLDLRQAGEAVRLGFPVSLAHLATYLMLPAMIIPLSLALPGNAIENLARIGYFTIAYQMVDRILPVTRSVAFALLPKITSAEEEEAGELAAKASRHTLMVSVAIFAVLVVFMYPIISILLGNRFLAVVGPFAIMAPGGVALSVAGVWQAHLLARKKPLQVAKAGIMGVVVALIITGLGFHYIPGDREVLAASLAVMIGTFVNAGMLLPAFCKAGKIGPVKALIPTLEDLREWRRIPGLIVEMIKRRTNGTEEE